MSQTHDDPRVTAYVFGELTPEEATAFERELEQSPELNQEVTAVRETITAIQFEFQSRGPDLSTKQQQAIERAIQKRTPPRTATVSPTSIGPDGHASKRAVLFAVLAASILLVAGLTLPYWRSQSPTEISMNSAPAIESQGDFPATANDPQQSVAANVSGDVAGQRDEVAEAGSLAIESLQHESKSSVAAEPSPFDAAPLAQTADFDQITGGKMDGVAEGLNHEIMREAAEPRPTRPTEAAKSLPAMRGADAADVSRLEVASGARRSQIAQGQAEDSLEMLGLEETKALGINAIEDSQRAISRGGSASMMGGTEGKPKPDLAMGAGMEMPSPAAIGGASQLSGSELSMGMNPPVELATAAAGADASAAAGEFGESTHALESQLDAGRQDASGDRYAAIHDNPFVDVTQAPLSTFSIDVDTASYGKLRSLLRNNILPRPESVRIEELLNYFDYDYPGPDGQHPFAASMEIAQCPWNPDHRLARIGIQAKEVETQRPSSNLVFLLDVSGSMNAPAKLPLVIEGMKLLTDQLTENDKVAIVVYAGAAGVVLESTRGDKKLLINEALDRLRAGGSTNGGQGIVLAYQIARDHFINGGTNRVILCSDGDFNVGVTGTEELVQVAKENANSNIFLSVLGFGYGNHNDEMMERISNEGNGNYAFIDSKREAEKVFVEELGGTLVTVAKDVKIQVEFNPKRVSSYRLIGYENRMLQAQDFADDKKDAGEIGAGHSVTAIYELVPSESDANGSATAGETLRYQTANELTELADSEEVLLLKLRYKQPDGNTSILMEVPVTDQGRSFHQTDRDFQFAAAVAEFGMLLRDSPHRGSATFSDVLSIARESARGDDFGYRTEFVELVEKAQSLRGE